jgi:hypothetical protein
LPALISLRRFWKASSFSLPSLLSLAFSYSMVSSVIALLLSSLISGV